MINMKTDIGKVYLVKGKHLGSLSSIYEGEKDDSYVVSLIQGGFEFAKESEMVEIPLEKLLEFANVYVECERMGMR